MRPTRQGQETVPRDPAPPGAEGVVSPPPREGTSTSSGGFDAERSLGTRGCPICDHLHRTAFGFLARWQNALSSDETVRADFASALGFCPAHAWQLEAVSSPAGSSAGYLPLVERIARRLAHAAGSPGGAPSVRDWLRETRDCRVCGVLRNAEAEAIGNLARYLGEPQGWEAYRRAQGPCLRHLVLLAAAVKDAGIAAHLLRGASEWFDEVGLNLKVFAEKSAAPGGRALCTRDEEDAFWRAITRIVGRNGVTVPSPEKP